MLELLYISLHIMLLYNENSEKRTLTHWALIYKNIDKEFTVNFEHIKHSLK